MEVTVIRSNRKTISLEVKRDLRVIVRVPKYLPKSQINKLLKEKEPWILNHIEKIKAQNEQAENEGLPAISQEELKSLFSQAKKVIPGRVEYFAQIIGVSYGRITIRNQKTRWGSCSSKGNLNFNCLLMLAPPEVLDYVVVHELCHRREMNHSKAFWALVAGVLPDYKKREAWLKTKGSLLMQGIN